MGGELGVSVLRNHQSVYVVVVIYYDFPVGCEVDVTFTTPEGVLLCKCETCDTVLAVYSLLAFPKTPMSSDGYLPVVAGFRKRRRQHGQSRANCY